MKIKVLKAGPYEVSSDIPLYLKKIESQGHVNQLMTVRRLETNGDYHLCRCGHSKNKPFCDGAHVAAGFIGTETADKSLYMDRVKVYEGESLNILDDDRCAFARFCHRENGDAWELTIKSGDSENRKQATRGASECIAGRLTSMDKDGNLIEDELEPSISVIEDPAKGVGAGLYVTGYVPIEDADGYLYEKRNRVALCRCGASTNKPFCDATHVTIRFRDGLLK